MARTSVSHEQIRRVAREKFGYKDLRPGQQKVIRLLLGGHDVLSVMPTGAGKSAIYQIAALFLNGPTVIVSPLIALQKDQLDSIEEKALPEAAVVNSTLSGFQREEAFEALEEGDLEFLFLSPEQLDNEKTLARLKESPPSLFVIDEAHCISEWGHDFRPAYVRIGATIEALNRPRVLALTATASPNVRDDIVRSLGMRKTKVEVWGFDRPNITLEVEKCPDEETKQRVLVERLRDLRCPGIIYVATRAHAEEVTELLREQNLAADFYHAGLNAHERTRIHEKFMDDPAGLIVATNAFGMGVDKPDIRFVVHYDIAESLDAYYQEIGRAGRDGQPALALLLYREADVGRRRAQSSQGKLDEDQVEQIMETIKTSDSPTDAGQIAEQTDIPAGRVERALNRLKDACAVQMLPAGEVVAAGRKVDPEVAAEQAVEEAENHRQQRRGRVEIMRDYAETDECRRRYLLNYFGEVLPANCGNCDNCRTGLADRALKTERHHPFPLKSRIVHKKWGEGTVMRYEGDKIVLLIDEGGYKSVVTDYAIRNELIQAAG